MAPVNSLDRMGRWIVIVMLSLVVLLIALVVRGAYQFVHPEATVDEAAMSDWKSEVSVGLSDLETVPALPGLVSSGPGTAGECTFDDLELFQPTAEKGWLEDPTNSRKDATGPSVDLITDHLIQRGYQVTDENLDLAPTRVLSKHSEAPTLRVALQAFSDRVVATVEVADSPTLCVER